eukprot:GHVU01150535.1.p1 GENE.GHVU01150535.1~~GHVU01150535.1.p1  ORF type:complete len:710 (+),score=102.05 GHVU01150535.1:190-2319(+)
MRSNGAESEDAGRTPPAPSSGPANGGGGPAPPTPPAAAAEAAGFSESSAVNASAPMSRTTEDSGGNELLYLSPSSTLEASPGTDGMGEAGGGGRGEGVEMESNLSFAATRGISAAAGQGLEQEQQQQQVERGRDGDEAGAECSGGVMPSMASTKTGATNANDHCNSVTTNPGRPVRYSSPLPHPPRPPATGTTGPSAASAPHSAPAYTRVVAGFWNADPTPLLEGSEGGSRRGSHSSQQYRYLADTGGSTSALLPPLSAGGGSAGSGSRLPGSAGRHDWGGGEPLLTGSALANNAHQRSAGVVLRRQCSLLLTDARGGLDRGQWPRDLIPSKQPEMSAIGEAAGSPDGSVGGGYGAANKSGNFVLDNGKFNIHHTCSFLRGTVDRAMRDRFNWLIALKHYQLSLVIIVLLVGWGGVLAIGLWAVTGGDAKGCLGVSNTVFDYYFLVIETMFTIGYGTPRYPSCTAANWYVSVIVTTGCIVQALCIGIVFAKFSAGSSRRWALAFSSTLCAQHLSSTPPSLIPQQQPGGPAEPAELEGHSSAPPPTAAPSAVADPSEQGVHGFSLSFRVMNITNQSFFLPHIKAFLIHHEEKGLTVTQFPDFDSDFPLEFVELPVTITVDNTSPSSPLHGVPAQNVISDGHHFELLVLMSFIDNRTAKPVEIRKSWRLSDAVWGARFAPIVSRRGTAPVGTYDVDVPRFDAMELLDSVVL